jgi:Fe2+ transport system protein FeoA
VSRVPDRDTSLLLYLSELALLPGCRVEIASVAPFNGPVAVRTETGEHAIGRDVAASIYVA